MPPKKKAATKKTTSKKVVTKKVAAKKTATSKKTTPKTAKTSTAAKLIKSVSAPLTKTQLHTAIAEGTGVAKKDVAAVFDALADIIHLHVKKRGPQAFTLPGLMKVKVTRKPATKARKGINPFNGEETVFKAKPARNVVKILALKKLKEMAN